MPNLFDKLRTWSLEFHDQLGCAYARCTLVQCRLDVLQSLSNDKRGWKALKLPGLQGWGDIIPPDGSGNIVYTKDHAGLDIARDV